MQTYLFYDIETTGLNKAFDQVLQFAAIRTDLDLQEMDRYEFNIKLNLDCIPSPRAVITHRIGLQETSDGLSEFEAIQHIHRLLNEPGTISIGYNSLGFDDEFLRFSFYRNLLPPYTHQYANQCNRMDLYPIAAMYFLYKNNSITWPQVAGQSTLKLEHINAANHFVSGRSHHAMVDVEATLALARYFLRERETWNYVTGYFNKRTDQDRAQQLPRFQSSPEHSYPEGILLDGGFGAANYYQCPALLIGEHNQYKNQSLWLRLDTANLSQTTEQSIPENTWVIRKKWGEPCLALPPKERFLRYITAERQALVEHNKNWLKQHPELLTEIIDYYRSYTYPVFPQADVDTILYTNGFWSDAENVICRRFHQATPADKALLSDNIKNTTLKALTVRILGRHYPDTLTDTQKTEFADYLRQINPSDDTLAMIDFKGDKRLTPQTALQDIASLRQQANLDAQQLILLDELEQYLCARFAS